eukprot:CAMPEP_0185843770 /NCGR_PEP_ID=MMETSP1354-20130828/165_1 /TAXON_ID=708628 /ORGANISM="Erythrolobus madagascarensis, Strain CCMP3276" /LENGTH=285 /DNA_ID=CAMNT_0028543317 /DNA_START=276 /DNA_END=1133 /DNA_ORIENTATION=-
MKVSGAIIALCAAAALAMVSAQQCRCDVQLDSTCAMLEQTGEGRCDKEDFPCDKCYCLTDGPYTCELNTIEALISTGEGTCDMGKVTYAKCPDSFEVELPQAPAEFTCNYNGPLPKPDYECTIPKDAIQSGITKVELMIVQSYDVTVTGICGPLVGEGSLTVNIEQYVVSGQWGPNDPVEPPFGLGRIIPDIEESVEVVPDDKCQGTGSTASTIDTVAKQITSERSVDIGASDPSFVDMLNANAGVADTIVEFAFTVDTGVLGNLLGAGLGGASTNTEYKFMFTY